ncbi:hypothetical protein TNIN_342341 [Trichonephila inaurata madagascariensis]|uniref:Uncharacterized protein n=1 Tax=Trichonephila inaurata madagascariensis TaxID=2747483 RepID=A0A8X6WND7_9ARAC|nr:hypothetical protein TNIN_342341 [Trichonephila inaurata madagascariensis]
MSGVRLKTLFWGNRGAKLASDHLTARSRSDFNILPGNYYFSLDSLTGHTLSVSVKGLSVCLNVPHCILDPVRSLSVRVKAPKGELKCWKAEHLTSRGKNDTFLLVSFPAKLKGVR